MAKRTKYDSMSDGNKWYQQQARKAFSILVQRAKARETITYQELGEALGLKKYFVSLRTVFSSISTTLAELQASWQEGDIPLITNLVTKTNGHPNQFVCAQLTGDPKKAPRQEEYDAVLEVIYNYPNWDAILKELGIEMGTQKSEKITSLSDFIEWTEQFSSREYVFRGISNEEYVIEAPAYSRLGREGGATPEKLLKVNRDMLEDARREGHDENMTDLELLAKLQHYGAATCLIDFTKNPLVALWFACQEGSSGTANGKVIAVDINSKFEFEPVTSPLLKNKINHFFERDKRKGYKLYQWQPHNQNSRILAQQSIFLFGGERIEPAVECIISKNSKQEILSALELSVGITEARLFPDFMGFASQYAPNKVYVEPSAQDYLNLGIDAEWKEDNMKEAINYYTQGILLNPNEHLLSTLYQKRASCYSVSGELESAIGDYDEAIELTSNYPNLYNNRGSAKSELGNYKEAITDFDKAIHLNPDLSIAYSNRGSAKSELGNYKEAITDFDKAIHLNPDDAITYINRGSAKFKMGHFKGAEQDLQMALQLVEQDENAELVAKFREKIDELTSRSKI